VDIQGLKGRDLKQRVRELLGFSDLVAALQELRNLPSRKVINPLFSFLYHTDDLVRWHAVTATGVVVADLADKDRESARVILRRIMWNLNDESGGIGWGSAEAMGEILACHKGLATEYASILISYIRGDGNFQEHELIQRGVLWGIARLAQEGPELATGAAEPVMPFLKSGDGNARGLAARIMGLLRVKEAQGLLVELLDDETAFALYFDRELIKWTVKRAASEALLAIH